MGLFGAISGDPDRLEAYSADMEPVVAGARSVVEDYGDQVRAFNAAEPNDLGTVVPDRSGQLLATLDALAFLDAQPAVFAFALRHLDGVRIGNDPPAFLFAGQRFDDLVAARLALPLAPVADVIALAGARGASRGAGEALADRYPDAWTDPHAMAHIEAELTAHADDVDFVLGFPGHPSPARSCATSSMTSTAGRPTRGGWAAAPPPTPSATNVRRGSLCRARTTPSRAMPQCGA